MDSKPMENQRQIKQAGLKVTVPRLKILHILETSEQRHLSAEEVYKELLAADEEIGLATVYRVLTQFEGAGLVVRHHFEGGQSVFELNRGSHHDHLVCVKCGAVVEFFDEVIEERQRAIAEQNAFKIVDHALVIYGDCLHGEDCPRRAAHKRAP
jgi:Fur family ferric uptake transcriptional regulator